MYLKKINIAWGLLLIIMLLFTNIHLGSIVVQAKEDDSSAKLKTALDTLSNSKYLSTAKEVSYNYSINGNANEMKYAGSKMIFTSGELIKEDKTISEKLIVECKKTKDGAASGYRLYVDPSDKNNYKYKSMGNDNWETIKSGDSKIVNYNEDYEGYHDNSNERVLFDIGYEYKMFPYGTVKSFKDKNNNTHVTMAINTGKLPENVIFYGLFSSCEIQDEFIINSEGKLIEYISNRHMGNMVDSTPREDGNLKIKVLFNYDKVDLSNTNNLDDLFTTYIDKCKEMVQKKGFAALEESYNVQAPVVSKKPVASVQPVLAAPTKLKAVRVKSSSVKLIWNSVKGASGYQVYRSTSSKGTYDLLKSTSTLYHTEHGLTKGKTYYYKVRAYKNAEKVTGYSNWTIVKVVN